MVGGPLCAVFGRRQRNRQDIAIVSSKREIGQGLGVFHRGLWSGFGSVS